MICDPDITIHFFIVKWMLTFGQAIVIILVWKLIEYLWRVTSQSD